MTTVLGTFARAKALLVSSLALLAAANVDAADRYWPPIVDPATHQYTPGRWVWADLVTSDVAKAAGVYGKVFGWTFETYGGEDDRDTYTLVLADGLPIGGMVFDARATKGKTPSARWIGLVSVTDPKAVATLVTQNGGKVVYAPVMLGERGETAVFRDPEGTLFGVVRSRNGDPDDYFAGVGEWAWLDLWTQDVDKAAGFYRAVLGYETIPAGDAASARSGVNLVSGGYIRAGIMQKHDAKATSVWLPYVHVADARKAADAARAAGGRVIYEPSPIGAMVVGIVADPTGAPVGILQLAGTEAR
jgi:predicted enzyme related to lactoylglutathione lyase